MTDQQDIALGVHRYNPDYGKGIFRRRIRLQSEGMQVVAELEDVSHGFRIHLLHDDATVTGIRAEMLRYPFNSCPGAIDLLQQYVGCALDSGRSTVRKIIDPSIHCTHLYDLTLLSLAHAARSERQRTYDIAVPDIIDDQTDITVHRNGALVHSWKIKSNIIVAPASLAGVPMMKGFYSRVSGQFCEDELEAAIVLQMGFYVSRARLLDTKNSSGKPATADKMPHESCHTYSLGVVGQAFRIGEAERDFTECPDMLLKFQ